ncbi:class I SAM-dependent methyltransferase [Paraburkholderia sediminicola]|uniref:class I SAM-dependent methyltransferase n=1 Tax=Paraburkholderia sediminicola TaxID=458836 RepID=UPI0038BB5D93
MNRSERLLSYADISAGCGLEIGPLDKPLVKRVAGRKIYYCDYADRETLREKSSADPNVSIDFIPEIDFVTTKISKDVFLGIEFDYVVASHVIEHVPNMIGWLVALLDIIKPDGRIILAVPDRRYTFDYIRPLSTVGEIVQAHLEKRSSPSFSQVYEGFSKAVRADTGECWKGTVYPDRLEHYYTKELAMHLATDAFNNGSHHDCHCWVFEYESFLAAICEIKEIGMLDVEVVRSSPPFYGSNEFHVVLGRA